MISAKAFHTAIVRMIKTTLKDLKIEVVSYEADKPIIRPSIRIDTEQGERTPLGEQCISVFWNVDLYFYAKDAKRPHEEWRRVRDALGIAFLGDLTIGDFIIPFTEPLEFDTMNGVLVGSTTISWTEILPEEDGEIMGKLHYNIECTEI